MLAPIGDLRSCLFGHGSFLDEFCIGGVGGDDLFSVWLEFVDELVESVFDGGGEDCAAEGLVAAGVVLKVGDARAGL